MKDRTSNAAYLITHAAFGLLVFSLVFVAVSSFVSNVTDAARLPAPGLSPDQVIRIQLRALHDHAPNNDGIAVAFRFASPDNRQKTGPLFRFASMLRSKSYRPLLNQLSVQYGSTIGHAQRSYTPVIGTDRQGQTTAYMWVLGRQTDGSCEGCWLTESVVPIGDMNHLRFA